jgi:NTE family protein
MSGNKETNDGETVPARVGIALSGGGSRAMAFHLGCLRTLHNLGVLECARVLATVSGGSVIGAMYVAHQGTFEEFEAGVRQVLRRGFVRPALRTALTTFEGVKAILALLVLLAACVAGMPFRIIDALAEQFSSRPRAERSDGWLPRRFASRTTVLLRVFDSGIFHGKTLGSLRRDRPAWIAVAAELRTGAAFYFGRNDAGCWRFGTTDPSAIRLAHAVAASAAYPLLLPALDELVTFRRRDGSLVTERVTLSDGGVYDNLGLSPLWPERDPQVGVQVEPVDTIIACRAGYGLRTIAPSLFVKARMRAAFATVHARAQNATMKRLFDLKDAGRLRSFALPYLDQDDRRLKYPPSDLIRREQVAGYPTNFSAMPDQWIDKLSMRGEQLTLAVIREHTPDLLPMASQNATQEISPTCACHRTV